MALEANIQGFRDSDYLNNKLHGNLIVLLLQALVGGMLFEKNYSISKKYKVFSNLFLTNVGTWGSALQ